MKALAPELVSPNLYSFVVDGASHKVVGERGGSGVWDLQLRGRRYHVDVVDNRVKVIRDVRAAGSIVAGPEPLRAPMPGLVVRVEVKKGELVEAGHGLLFVEAMKMENSLTTPVEGRIGTIYVVAGQTVEKDEILMDMMPPAPESEREGD